MASELYNIIEGVSREKGIDPQIVVSAVEDAIVVATRKYYKTQENLRAVLDKDSGKINAYAVKSIVETPEQVEDPNLQVTVEQARKLDPSGGSGRRVADPESDGRNSGADCGATGEASHFPESARGGTRHGLQRIHRACERDRECDREADRRAGCDSRYRQGRSAHGTQGAIAAGIVRGGRADSGRDRARGKSGEGSGRDRFALRSGISPASVPDRSAGNL